MDFLNDLDQALTDAAQTDAAKEANAAKENVAANNMGGASDQEMVVAAQKIKITVQAQGRADVVFEVNSDKKLLKLMTAYASAMKLKLDGLRFFNMDNERLHKFDTYKDKNIQDGDVIEVRVEQEGGVPAKDKED